MGTEKHLWNIVPISSAVQTCHEQSVLDPHTIFPLSKDLITILVWFQLELRFPKATIDGIDSMNSVLATDQVRI